MNKYLLSITGVAAVSIGVNSDLLDIGNKTTDNRTEQYGNLEDELLGMDADEDDDLLDGDGGISDNPELDGMLPEDLGAARGLDGEAQFTSAGTSHRGIPWRDGIITVNGKSYEFRTGGHGRGFLPAGEYVVSNGRRRTDASSMAVDGYGYSFDLSDKQDPRFPNGKIRDELRIHPDGGTPGTMGCIGIKGNGATQKQFYEDLKKELDSNGGRMKIKVG